MQMKVATHSLCSPPNYQVPPLYPLGLNLPQGDRNPQPFKLQASHPTCTRRVFKVMGSSQPLTGPGAGLCGGPSRPTSFFLFEASSNTPIPDGRFEHQTSKNLNLVGRPLYSERLPTPPVDEGSLRCSRRGCERSVPQSTRVYLKQMCGGLQRSRRKTRSYCSLLRPS